MREVDVKVILVGQKLRLEAALNTRFPTGFSTFTSSAPGTEHPQSQTIAFLGNFMYTVLQNCLLEYYYRHLMYSSLQVTNGAEIQCSHLVIAQYHFSS